MIAYTFETGRLWVGIVPGKGDFLNRKYTIVFKKHKSCIRRDVLTVACTWQDLSNLYMQIREAVYEADNWEEKKGVFDVGNGKMVIKHHKTFSCPYSLTVKTDRYNLWIGLSGEQVLFVATEFLEAAIAEVDRELKKNVDTQK